MKHPTILIGSLVAITLIALFVLGAIPTLAQSTGSAVPVNVEMISIGGESIPIIPLVTNAPGYFTLMKDKPGQQAFYLRSTTGDFQQTYVLLETNDNNEKAYVYVRLSGPSGDIYKKIDCRTDWFTFNADALTYSKYLAYTNSSINFAQIIQEECQSDSAEGNGLTLEAFLPYLRNGKMVISQGSTANTGNTTTDNQTAPIPLGTPTSAINNASTPAVFQTCDLGSGPTQYVKMSGDLTSSAILDNTNIEATDTTEYAGRPRNIVFTDVNDKPVYLLQVWHFNNNETIAASVYQRFDNVKDSLWDITKEATKQGVDNLTTLSIFGLVGLSTDIGHPADAITKAISKYNTEFNGKSGEKPIGQPVLLPGYGKLTLGTRLCVFEDGMPKSYWGTVQHERKSILPTGTSGVPLIGDERFTATYLSSQRGKVVVSYRIDQPLTPGSKDEIAGISIDASQDKPKSVFRFRLSDAVLTSIKNADTTAGPDSLASKSLVDVQNALSAKLIRKSDRKTFSFTNIRDMEGTLFGSANPKYFSSAAIKEPATGRPTKLDETNPFYAGEYELVLSLKGYKDYRMDLSVTPAMLSTLETQNVQDKDVFKLASNEIKFRRNCASACTDIQSCMACLDSGIIENLNAISSPTRTK